MDVGFRYDGRLWRPISVTDTGRFVEALTLAVGVGLVGALTGFLANAFLGANAHFTRQQLEQVERVRRELEEIRAELRGCVGPMAVTMGLRARRRERPPRNLPRGPLLGFPIR